MKNSILQKFLITAIMLAFSFSTAISTNKLPFRLDRVSTDYNGVVYNGKNILAYGNYGIITFSTDKGETWKQISLGDRLDILKIISINNVFYALTPYSILKSSDNGFNWTQKTLFDEPKLKDFTFGGDFFYIISENSIFRLDSSLGREHEIILQFEFSSLSEIVYLNNYLFCIDNKYFLYKFNLETNEIATIDVHQTILKGAEDVRDISHLKVFNSNLYLITESINQNKSQLTHPENADHNIRHYLLKSTDLGENWEVVSRNIRLTKEYQIIDGVAYFLTHKGIKDTTNFRYYYTVRYFKVDSTGNDVEINKDEVLDRMVPAFTGENPDYAVPNTFKVNMFVKIDDGLIIAVGPNKTILKSKNNGQSWELVSYFKPLCNLQKEIKFIGQDTIVVLTGYRPYFFISFNQGATFLPPLRFVENFPDGVDKFLIWNDGTFGFIRRKFFSHTIKIDESKYKTIYDSTHFIIHYSGNLGKSFSKKIFYRSYISHFDSISFDIVATKIINEDALFIFSWRTWKRVDTIPDSYCYFFDKSFNVIDSIVQKKIRLYDLLLEDTIFFSVDTPFLLKSEDFGRNWDTILSSLKDYNNLELHYKQYLLIQNFIYLGPGKEYFKLYKYNLDKSTLDSVDALPSGMEFFVHNDTIFAWGYRTNKLYYFPLGIENIRIYDSIEVSELLNSNSVNIIGLTSDRRSSYFHILKKVGSVAFTSLYEINLAKVVYSQPEYLSVESNDGRSRVYLNHSKPYPIPTRKYLACRLLLDFNLIDNNFKVEIYDIYGKKQLGTKVEIESESPKSQLLKVDCSELASGIYFILLRWSGGSETVPIVVE